MAIEPRFKSIMEDLAKATAVEKELKKAISELRSQADACLLDLFAETGADRLNIDLGGGKVGTYSVSTTKEKETQRVQVSDGAAYLKWAIENNLVSVDDGRVIAHCNYTGEIPDGAEIVTERVEGGKVKGTVLKVDEAKVFNAIPNPIAGLLEA